MIDINYCSQKGLCDTNQDFILCKQLQDGSCNADTTPKPTPICVHFPLYGYRTHYIHIMRHTSKGMWLIHIPRASTVAMLKTRFESCEVPIRQEQSVK